MSKAWRRAGSPAGQCTVREVVAESAVPEVVDVFWAAYPGETGDVRIALREWPTGREVTLPIVTDVTTGGVFFGIGAGTYTAMLWRVDEGPACGQQSGVVEVQPA